MFVRVFFTINWIDMRLAWAGHGRKNTFVSTVRFPTAMAMIDFLVG